MLDFLEEKKQFRDSEIADLVLKTNIDENKLYGLGLEFKEKFMNCYNGLSISTLNDIGDSEFRHEIKYCGVFGLHTENFCKGFAKYYGENAIGLDAMSGKGLLAKSIEEHGVKMYTADDKSWEFSKGEDFQPMSAIDSFNKHKKELDFVILSWCPFDLKDDEIGDDFKIINTIRGENLDIDVIIISNGYNGFTHSKKFWDNAEPLENEKMQELIFDNYVSLGKEDYAYLVKPTKVVR